MPHALDSERGFRTRSRFSFYDFITVARPVSPFRFIADLGLGIMRAYEKFEEDGHALLERLLETNSQRVQSDVNDRVLESRHRLQAEIRVLLTGVHQVAELALAHAKAAQNAGAAAVESALAKLRVLEQDLFGLVGADVYRHGGTVAQ